MRGLIICMFIFFGNWFSSELCAQSLDDYLAIAAENNPQLTSKYALFEASLQRVTQAHSLPNPSLSFGYFIRPVETRVGPQLAKLGLAQMFPWFGTLKVQGEMQAYLAEANYQRFLDARNELFHQVRSAWYPIYELNQKLAIQQQYLDVLLQYKELATSRYKNDKADMVDVLRVDVQLIQAKSDLANLRDQKRPLIIQFNSILNRDGQEEVMVPDSLEPESFYLDQLKEDSLFTSHPTLAAYEMELKSAQRLEEIAHKRNLPGFGVGVDYVMVGDNASGTPNNGKDAIMPMVSMSLPIFRSANQARVKEAQFKQEGIAASRDAFANNLRSSYAQTIYSIVKQRREMTTISEQIEVINRSLSLLTKSYVNAEVNMDDLLVMQQQRLFFQMKEAVAFTNYHLALSKFEYLTAKTE